MFTEDFCLAGGTVIAGKVEQSSPFFTVPQAAAGCRGQSVHIRNKLPAAYRSSSAGGSRRHVTAICEPGFRLVLFILCYQLKVWRCSLKRLQSWQWKNIQKEETWISSFFMLVIHIVDFKWRIWSCSLKRFHLCQDWNNLYWFLKPQFFLQILAKVSRSLDWIHHGKRQRYAQVLSTFFIVYTLSLQQHAIWNQ